MEVVYLVKELAWKDVLDCKKGFGHISVLAHIAVEAGYNYMVWNNQVFQVLNNGSVSFQGHLPSQGCEPVINIK